MSYTSYDRGIEFERFVAELLKKAGFSVQHNVVLAGRSGVKHQVDVLAIYRTPVTEFRVLVECKNWLKPINKDVVMKVYNEVRDLGLDKGMIFTSSYATPEAISYARTVGIEIIDGHTLQEITRKLGVGMEQSAISLVSSAEYVILGEKCMSICGPGKLCQVYYYPCYELTLTYKQVIREGFFRKREYIVERTAVTYVDAVFGYAAAFDERDGLILSAPLPLGIDRLEVHAYRVVTSAGMASAEQVASYLGMSTQRARKLLESLLGRGLMKTKIINRRKYYVPLPLPLVVYGEKSMGQLCRFLTSTNVKPADSITVATTAPLESVINVIQSLTNFVVTKHTVIYYPLLMIMEKGKVSVRDGRTCRNFRNMNVASYVMEISSRQGYTL